MTHALRILALTLCTGSVLGATDDPLPVLIVSGANNHWQEWTTPSLQAILEESGKFEVDVTYHPDVTLADAEKIAGYRAFVLDYNGPRWGDAAERNFLAAVEGGTGVSVIHAANNAFPGWKEYEELVALMWREGTGHGRFHPFNVEITDRDHPITRDMPPMLAHPDELYHKLVHMHDTDYRVLATAHSSKESGGTGADEPMIMVKNFGQGRIFHTPLGHVWTDVESTKVSHLDPQFRDLIVRGTEWAATGEVSASRLANTLTDAERAAGWQLLFDGKTIAGLRGYKKESFPDKGWAIEDGTLHKVAGAGGGDVISANMYQDFEFAFEWKVAEGANSGIMYRVTEDHGAAYETGPEYQILDDTKHHDGKNESTSAGALYALHVAKDKWLRPVGEWNTGKILLIGNHVEHWLNGRRIVSADLHSDDWNERVAASKFAAWTDFGKRPAGHIALQDHGDDVWFRNLKVRDLSPGAVREDALFDGTSTKGWTAFLNDGAKKDDVWYVREGVLVCAGKPAGYLMTEGNYTNYVLRLQWRYPEGRGGNSGVLLRKIGPDKVWPRSIEAQLQAGRSGDFWNIGEFPMETVAARTKGRHTAHTHSSEKPLGQWNDYEITVWHDHVVLRVNGEVLNQAWDCLEIPGKICLQSEGAEHHIRNIMLVPLP